MELARHRALTQYRLDDRQRTLFIVEMELARHRALTHAAHQKHLFFFGAVEMELARHRALTHFFGYAVYHNHPVV